MVTSLKEIEAVKRIFAGSAVASQKEKRGVPNCQPISKKNEKGR